MRDARLSKLAEVLVNYSTGVKKDQLVRISGPPVASPLILEIFEKVLEAGGHPFIRMGPEDAQEMFYKQASEAQLKYCSPIIFMNVNRGSTLDETTSARISSPFSKTTPVARPFLCSIFAIGALVRISTPASRAASAIEFEIAPVPPRANPHERNAPSISPM